MPVIPLPLPESAGPSVGEERFWPQNRKSKPKPPSPEYLATPLSDNPLGLTGMVPVESYGTPPQENDDSGHRYAMPWPSLPQVPSRRRRERDVYSFERQEDTRSPRRSTSRTSQEYTSRSDRHFSTAITANSPPYKATAPNEIMSPIYPSSLCSSQMSEILYLVELPATDLYSPLRLMSPESIASTPSPSYTPRDWRSTQLAYRGS